MSDAKKTAPAKKTPDNQAPVPALGLDHRPRTGSRLPADNGGPTPRNQVASPSNRLGGGGNHSSRRTPRVRNGIVAPTATTPAPAGGEATPAAATGTGGGGGGGGEARHGMNAGARPTTNAGARPTTNAGARPATGAAAGRLAPPASGGAAGGQAKPRPRSVGRTPAEPLKTSGSARGAESAGAGGGEETGRAKFGRRAHSATYAENKISKSLLGRGDVVDQNAEGARVIEEDGAAQLEHQQRLKQERATLAAKVAEAPAGYQAEMPKHTDLATHHHWEKLLQTIHKEFDMSCLTACLSPELDEDIPWNPEMLLVQLTSSLRDAAESRSEANATLLPSGPRSDVRLGTMTGGEVIRRRRDREADPDLLVGQEFAPEPENTRAAVPAGAAGPTGAASSPSRRGQPPAAGGATAGAVASKRPAGVAPGGKAATPAPKKVTGLVATEEKSKPKEAAKKSGVK